VSVMKNVRHKSRGLRPKRTALFSHSGAPTGVRKQAQTFSRAPNPSWKPADGKSENSDGVNCVCTRLRGFRW
jgi:hypothetical protein